MANTSRHHGNTNVDKLACRYHHWYSCVQRIPNSSQVSFRSIQVILLSFNIFNSMNKTAIVWIIVLVLVVIGGYFLFSSNGSNPAYTTSSPTENTNSTPTNTAPAATVTVVVPKTVTVTYTDTGFSPASLEINKGDSVKFVNQSSKKMWVASNPHPTHTDYPEFDEKSAAGSGGAYQFTFMKIGQWGYHNHFSPRDGGTVVVQ